MAFNGFTYGFMGANFESDLDMSDEAQQKRNVEMAAEENEFWSSPQCEVILMFELPFWVLAPDGEYSFEYENTSLSVTLENDLVEVSDTWICNTPFRPVIDLTAPNRTEERLSARKIIQEHINIRQTKSILSFSTKPLQSAVQSYFRFSTTEPATISDIRLFHTSEQYLSALAYGHIEAINTFIASYKASSRDPYASTISQWSIQNWYIKYNDEFRQFPGTPYHASRRYPALRPDINSDTSHPVFACSREELQRALKSKITPGAMELLTAWSKYYQGDYTDCIRHAITAIEVGLEFGIKEELKRRGRSDVEIEIELNQTRNSFADRFDLYERLIKKKAPGPLLNEIPYLHGIRFRSELDRSRRLRHEIVHEGKRLSAWDTGASQRVIETMSWLFEWITGFDVQNNNSQNRLYSFFAMLQGRTFLGISIKDGYIIPLRLNIAEHLDDTHPLNHFIVSMLDSLKTGNIDFTTRIAIRILGVNADVGSSKLSSTILPNPVYEFGHNDNHFCIFDCSTSGLMTVDDAFRFIAATKCYSSEFPKRHPHFIVISNHQKDLDPRLSSRAKVLGRCNF